MLRLRWTDEPHAQSVDRARAAAGKACPVTASCTMSAQGRLLRRSFHAESRECVQGDRDTLAFKQAMRTRSIWMEGRFAEAKQWHGLDRCRVRGLATVNIPALLVAAGQNLKRRLREAGWERRGFPGATNAAPAGSPPARFQWCGR